MLLSRTSSPFLQGKPMKPVDFFSLKLPTIGDVVLRGEIQSPLWKVSSSCLSFLNDHEKRPTGDHLRGEDPSPPSMDSSLRVSYPYDLENNRNEVDRDTSPHIRIFFPLTPDQSTKETRNSPQETVPTRPKRKYMVSPTNPETLVVDKKAKCSRIQKEKKDFPGCDTEEDKRNGVSTELVLGFDPYKIKKKLTHSDLGHLSRLLMGRELVRSHVLRWMSKDTVEQVESSKGAEIIVKDDDTCSEHQLVFALWTSSGSYVLKGGWIKEFVKRRGLADEDEVGIYWDPIFSKFHFRLLHKAN